MALISIPVNLFITFPFFITVYFNGNPAPIIGMYQVLLPWVDSITKAVLVFNTPFNFVLKGLVNATIAFFIYKPISPILKGRQQS
jgi:riboflavin transporter FmnP